jgi:tripartite-type tricarboxylate transporter receptor subunit TctC
MSTRMVLGLVCSLVVMLQGSADYPAKPVRIIEPFGAGGGPDIIARAISPKLTALWGQPVRVENHPGAGSTAAPALVAQLPADGYTLLVNTSAQAYSAALLKNLPGNTTPEAIADTVADRTSYLITPISYALADIRAGRLRALGVTTNTRPPLLSEVPTIAEAGVTGFDYPIWYGVWLRTGTPAGVVDKLAKDIARVLAALICVTGWRSTGPIQ